MMKKTSILLLSDIHLGVRNTENQYYVIDGFIQDAASLLRSREESELYVICAGDLVQAADNKDLYTQFNSDIISLLQGKIDLRSENILFVPGNHDAQQDIIEADKISHFNLLERLVSEDSYNTEIHSNPIFDNIFNHFKTFANQFPNSKWTNNCFLSFTFDEKWTIGCLNTALATFAHIDSREDEKKLGIETRNLTKWIEDTQGKKRILVMHHPLSSLCKWAADELKSIIARYIDIVITGHTHSQELDDSKGANREIHNIHLPHLFHDKSEREMGYCILDLDSAGEPDKIQYREWNPRRKKFVPGVSFVDNEDGVEYLQNKEEKIALTKHDKAIEDSLEKDFRQSMQVFQDMPEINWEPRRLSTKRIDHNLSIPDENLFDENKIFDSPDNLVILTPRNYGLTCYGKHFALKLWKERKEFALFIENPNLKTHLYESKILNRLEELGLTKEDVRWIVIDEWVLPQKQRKEIISFLQQFLPNVRLLFLSPRLEKYFNDNDELSIFDGFNYLYMTPLSRGQLRNIANTFNSNKFIAEEEVLLKRLDDDIKAFNMHRSPFNCITLLYVFKNSFEENPVNRTEVLEKVLSIIFDTDETPTYSTIPDQKDCRFVLGKFCGELIQDNTKQYTFSQNQFITNIREICNTQMISVDANYLFDLLLRNHIILPYDNLFRFRSSYWVYFFCAIQMQNDSEFSDYMLSNKRYLHFPLVLEFYSGLNRQQNNAVAIVINDFKQSIETVIESVGSPKKWNPYGMLKVVATDEQKQRIKDSLENQICGSNLPSEVKDSIADIDYDQRKPFNQNVYKILEEYSVVNLMNFIPIASRVLRNSDYVSTNLKKELFDLVISAWKVLIETLALLSPILALKGKVKYGGASFEFVNDISEYSFPERLLLVIGAIPENVLRWFEGDLYSNRNAPLYYEYIKADRLRLLKHLASCLIIRNLPDQWESNVRSYLNEVSENSFFIMDALNEMRLTYSTKVISDEDASRLKNLMKTTLGRIRTRNSFPTRQQINKVISPDDIPQRISASDE